MLSSETYIKIIRSNMHCSREKAQGFVRFCDSRMISVDERNPYPMEMARDYVNVWRMTERKHNILLRDLNKFIHKNRKYPYVTEGAVRMVNYLRLTIGNKDNRMADIVGQVIVQKYEQKQPVNIPNSEKK